MTPTELHTKYIEDLKLAMLEQSQHTDKAMLLSGGMDSLLLLLVVIECFGVNNIKCYTFVGKDDLCNVMQTYDLEKAQLTAKSLNVPLTVFAYTKQEIMNVFQTFTGVEKVFDLVSMGFFKLFTNDANITNSDIIWGEGADRLYGSTSSYLYMDTTRLTKELGISRIEAKNKIKSDWFNRTDNKSDLTYFFQCLTAGNNNVILPYQSDRVKWMNKVSFDIVKPLNKGFVREAILERWPHLSEDLVKRKRTFMEGGTGLYEIIKADLLKQYPGIKQANKIAKMICSKSQTTLVP